MGACSWAMPFDALVDPIDQGSIDFGRFESGRGVVGCWIGLRVAVSVRGGLKRKSCHARQQPMGLDQFIWAMIEGRSKANPANVYYSFFKKFERRGSGRDCEVYKESNIPPTWAHTNKHTRTHTSHSSARVVHIQNTHVDTI